MKLLRVREVVAHPALSERTVRAMLADGHLVGAPPRGLRVVWIPEAEVDRLMRGEGRRRVQKRRAA